MKRWKWATDKSTFNPIVICPYCDTAFNPFATRFSYCIICSKRVLPPKKDYWESMEGEEK